MDHPAVQLKNVEFAYADGTVALRDVSFEIHPGEAVAIVGPNGAGKSTLIWHLNGILRGKGEITILGLPMEEKNLPLIRRRVGIVFQDPDDQLFMPKIFDDVAFGPLNCGMKEEEVRRRVAWALDQVDLAGYEDRIPHHLSFGEKKKVSIAAILSLLPEILVLDEPSSNLDPRSRRGLLGLLKSLTMTKIIATHDLEMVLEICSRCLILDRGRLVADGDCRGLLSDEEIMEKHGLEVPLSLKMRSKDRGQESKGDGENCRRTAQGHSGQRKATG